MMEESKIKKYLENALSEKRFKHSLGVAEEAERLADKYGTDKKKAYLAGLVHDVAKEIDTDSARNMLKDRFGIRVDPVTYNVPKLLHAPLGACLAQTEFGIFDAEILDAVKYHTTAKADMSLLTKIIYMADYIEPNRDFEGVEELRKQAYQDLDEAIITGLDYTISELLSDGKMFHPDTVHARNYLILQKIK
ncbi:MAG: HD domain-containing protein [Clostridiales bacterium]|nr:HD domain-containing protein [Clostridiales bacterium]